MQDEKPNTPPETDAERERAEYLAWVRTAEYQEVLAFYMHQFGDETRARYMANGGVLRDDRGYIIDGE